MKTFSALLALCEGNSPVTGEFPSQRPVTRSFEVFFDMRLNKRLSKKSKRRWFETPSRSLWCHCNVRYTIHCSPLCEILVYSKPCYRQPINMWIKNYHHIIYSAICLFFCKRWCYLARHFCVSMCALIFFVNQFYCHLWPLLLKSINFYPSMDKQSRAQ